MSEAERAFEASRRLLEGIAYRMLGTLADAQDVVQETHMRWLTVDVSEIRDSRAWLVTVCTRLATNALKSARLRRETYVGTWLPEPVVLDTSADAQLVLDESVSLAFLVVLDALSPLERAAFLLHDVFDYDFRQIGEILGRSEEACRKLASRARVTVRENRPRTASTPEVQHAVVSSFVHALREGDVQGIERLLARDARLYADGGGKARATRALEGAGPIAALFRHVHTLFGRTGVRFEVETRSLSGLPGVITREDGVLATAMSFEIEDGRIRAIYAQRNPDKLAQLARVPC
jgi:RNA polymerase sigma-70 factor (ECF subfamily)